MKKTLIIMFIVVALPCFAIAGTGSIGPNNTILGNNGTAGDNNSNIGRLSTGVTLYYNTVATGYSIITKHASGPLVYGTAADSVNIYRTDDTAEAAAPEASVSSEFDGWDSL